MGKITKELLLAKAREVPKEPAHEQAEPGNAEVWEAVSNNRY